eukprot:4902679-Amphidinium_carterae.4
MRHEIMPTTWNFAAGPCAVVRRLLRARRHFMPQTCGSDTINSGSAASWAALPLCLRTVSYAYAGPVRYADNMSHVGISDFWSIVAVIVTLNCLSLFVPSWSLGQSELCRSLGIMLWT